MPRTQANKSQLKDRVLTGASLVPEMMFYDETFSYGSGDQVIWQGEQYTANVNIVGGSEGILTNSPDGSADWDLQPNMVYTVSPSAADSILTTRTDVQFNTENISSPYCSLAGGGQVQVNSDGVFLVSYSIGSNNTTSATRTSSAAFLQVNGVDVPNAEINLYNRDTNNGRDSSTSMIALNLSAGDLIKVQMTATAAGRIQTIPNSCNINIFGLDTISGPQGPMGPSGPAGDLVWLGVWAAGTYNQYDTVEYQGTSYTCLLNGTTSTAGTNLGVDWDIVALKGADGAGATITIQDNGTGIPNTPHGTLNFQRLKVTDAGGGVADITVNCSIAECSNSTAQTFADIPVAIQLAGITSTTECTIVGTTFTINTTGKYKIRGKVSIGNTNNTRCNPNLYYEKNGVLEPKSLFYMYSRQASDGSSTGIVNTIDDFVAGDVIEYYVVNNKANNLTVLDSESYFEIEYKG